MNQCYMKHLKTERPNTRLRAHLSGSQSWLAFIVLMISFHLDQFSSVSYVRAETPLESSMGASGIDLGLSLTGELGARLDSPGASRASTERRAALFVPLTLTSSRLLGIDLGTLTLQGLVIYEDPDLARGVTIVDDLHAYSNLRAEDRAQLFELFWEREWGSWLTRIGKIDANNHFAVSEYEAHLINGAAGFSPSIVGLPSYPDSAWSAQLAYRVSRLEALAGVFDGGSTEINSSPTGMILGLSPSALRGGLFWAAQITSHLGGTQAQDAPLHLTVGAWTHRGELIPLSTQSDSEEDKAQGAPSSGLYITGDWEVARLNRGRALGLGWQAAMSPTMYPLHLSVALTLDELWSPLWGAQGGGRLAFGASSLSRQSHPYAYDLGERPERLLELTLTSPISPYLILSVSGIHLFGVQGERDAHLVVTRLTVGIF